MDTSPEKNTSDNSYELKLEEDTPMTSGEAEEDTPMTSGEAEDAPPQSPLGDDLFSLDVTMSDNSSSSSSLPGEDGQLMLDTRMTAAEEVDDPRPPAAEDDQSLLKRRGTAATRENGSSTISAGESASWSSEIDTSFKQFGESNGGDEYEEEEYEIKLQQAEGDVVERENGAAQSYTESEERRAAYTSEAFAGAGASSEIEWSNYDVNREYLASRFKDVDIDALMRAAFHDKQIQGKQIEYREGSSLEEIGLREGETVIYEAEESDEEVVELEFEAAVDKIHTHDDYGMYCPNCSNRITRVVLRRKIKQRRVLVASGRDRQDLLGCLSCFSIFIPSGNKLNPFKIFGGKRGRDETTQLQEEQLPTSAAAVPSSDTAVPSLDSAVPAPGSAQVEDRKLDFFWFLKKRRVDESGSDLTSPLLQEPSPAAAVTPTLSRDEAIKEEGMLQTSTTTITSEAIEQGGGVRTSTTTVTSESRDATIKQGGGVQTSTTTVTSESRDMAIKQGEAQTSTTTVTSESRDMAIKRGEAQTSTTVTSESWDETVKPEDASQIFTSKVTPKPRDEALRPAGPARGGNIQIPQEQPVSDGTTVATTNTKQVKEKGFDIFWFLKKGRADESDLRTPLIPVAAQIPASSTAFSAVPGIIQTSTTTVTSKPRDETIKQDGKFQTSTTTVTSKPGDEAIAQQGYLRTSTTTVTTKPGDKAIEQQQMFQTSTTGEDIKQEGKFQTSMTTVTSKPRDEATEQEAYTRTSTTAFTSMPGDEAIKQQGIFQTSTGDEAIKKEGKFQTLTTTVISEPGDEAIAQEGIFQASTRDEAIDQQGTFQRSTGDETFKQDGKFRTSTTTVISKPGDKVIAQDGIFQTSTGDEAIKQEEYLQTSSRNESIEQQGIFQRPTGDEAIKQEGKFPSSTTTVTPKLSRDEAIKEEGILQTSTRDEVIEQQGYLPTSTRDEAMEQQGTFQRYTGDETFKQDGKFQTLTTTVTSKPGDKVISHEGTFQTSTRDEAIKQEGYLQTSPRDEAIEQQRTFQQSTGDETFKQHEEFQTSTTTVTSKLGDKVIVQEGIFQTPTRDEAFKQGGKFQTSTTTTTTTSKLRDEVNKQEETAVYDSVTTTETFRGETMGKPERVATAPAIGKVTQTTAQQGSTQDSVITTETTRVENARKPERVAIAAAAVGSAPHISSRQESIQDRNVIIDVYGKQGEVIRQAKPPVQPQLEIRGDGPSSGGDVRITVEETRTETQTTESTDVAVSTTRTEIVTESQPSAWFDILKSIVYGGLTESVISLFVVSLAIASNATAMNVVAIGSAFVVGCFILLLHNLRVLRYGDSTQTSEQRYQVQLGKIERFPLHAFVAMVSHVVFGLIPPVIFGFAFRETGDIEFKMISVGVASFICIFILAIAQAYVRGEQTFMAYFKTVLYYVGFAAIAAGAAFGIAYLLRDPFPCPAALEL